MHNILQGVSLPDERISDIEKTVLTDWIQDNAKRYWLSDGGPLRPASEGGADVIIVRNQYHTSIDWRLTKTDRRSPDARSHSLH